MMKQEVVVNLDDRSDVSPAALLVQVACRYDSNIHIEIGPNRTINAKSIMGVMTYDYQNGETLTVTAEGPDEAAAVEGVCAFLSGKES